MRLKSLRQANRGFTLVELIISVGVSAWIGLVIAKYVALPAQMTTTLNTVNNEQSEYSATNIPIADLKSAVGTSIQWNLIDPSQTNPPYDPAVNPQFIPWFQIYDPTVTAPALPISYVCYAYLASTKSVVREYIPGAAPQISPITACAPVAGDNAQQTVIVTNVLPPTAFAPLFSKDGAATNLIVFTTQFQGTGNTVTSIVRRAYIRS